MGATGVSRQALLSQLQHNASTCTRMRDALTPRPGYIPSSMMVPPRRMSMLMTQAQAYQRQQCTYHNAPPPGALPGVPGDLLYVDHECNMAVLPCVTTLILDEHMDEVWNLSWNHAGTQFATAGKDRRAIRDVQSCRFAAVWGFRLRSVSTDRSAKRTVRFTRRKTSGRAVFAFLFCFGLGRPLCRHMIDSIAPMVTLLRVESLLSNLPAPCHGVPSRLPRLPRPPRLLLLAGRLVESGSRPKKYRHRREQHSRRVALIWINGACLWTRR
jgi:hypothetical protein